MKCTIRQNLYVSKCLMENVRFKGKTKIRIFHDFVSTRNSHPWRRHSSPCPCYVTGRVPRIPPSHPQHPFALISSHVWLLIRMPDEQSQSWRRRFVANVNDVSLLVRLRGLCFCFSWFLLFHCNIFIFFLIYLIFIPFELQFHFDCNNIVIITLPSLS